MKVSLNWINQYLRHPLPAEKAAEILTGVGLEVEGVEAFESVKGGMKGLVVGYVVEKEKHPDADRLSVTKVDVGTGELLQIVCGAPNVDKGQKVVVATVGTVLYPGGEKLEIKKSKIRGVESHGMICAEDEIGVGASHDGIIVLPADLAIGTPAADYFGVENDTVLELNITPNRSDAASHTGAARDMAAYQLLSSSDAGLVLPDVSQFTPGANASDIQVVVENTQACPRYSGLVIRGLQVKDSPAWLQNRLKAIGLKPINNVVDITNFVLHELGQPLHAFDADKISGNKIVVRNAAEGEKFTTLDGVERTLSAADLMICDAEKPMCIGGVFGGMHSGVSGTTTSVFLESAYFHPVSIRKTARRHGLHTDASFRFERGTDPNHTLRALYRAALLITEIAGGQVTSTVTDLYPQPISGPVIPFSLTRLKALAGQEIPADKVEIILHALDTGIHKISESEWELSIPTYKVDVLREVDVVEEIMRIYGYNEIIIHENLSGVMGAVNEQPDRPWRNRLAGILAANGLSEILTNSLSHSAHIQKTGILDAATLVTVENPISSELDILRPTLLFSGLEVVRHNLNHKVPDVKIFEFGKIYWKGDSGEKPRDKYKEKNMLGIWLTGKNQPESWLEKPAPVDFYTLKGIVYTLFQTMRIPVNQPSKSADDPLFAEAFTLTGFRDRNRPLARWGSLRPALLKAMDIKQEVWYAEIDWELALASLPAKAPVYAEIPKFPAVRRDLALVLDKKVEYQSVRDWAFKVDKQILRDVSVFDVYEGKGIPEGKKSYAVSFRFQDNAKTLTDAEIDKVMDKLMKTYTEQLGAEIRS